MDVLKINDADDDVKFQDFVNGRPSSSLWERHEIKSLKTGVTYTVRFSFGHLANPRVQLLDSTRIHRPFTRK